MSKLRNILAVFVAALTALAVTPAFAADGDITITNTVNNATYSVYKIFDVTYSGDAVSYTIPTGSKIDTTSEAFKAVFDTTTNGGNTYVTKKSVATDAQVIAYLQSLSDDVLGTEVAKGTGNGASITVNAKGAGYFLIKGTDGTKSGVTISTARPTATVQSKIDETPSITEDGKKVNAGTAKDPDWKSVSTANVGNTQQFKVEFNALNYYITDSNGVKSQTPITTYTITDTPNGYAISDSTVKVSVGNTELSKTASETSAYYSVEVTAEDDSTRDVPRTKSVVVTIHNYDKGVNGTQFVNPSTVTVTYSGTYLKGVNTKREASNKVKVAYNGEAIPTQPETHTYNYAVNITKVDANKTDTKLPGAQFVLKNSDGGFYKYDNGVVSWVSSQNQATVVTTDNNGAAAFQGLKAGKYTLVEVKAPDGYNLASDTPVTLNDVTTKQASTESLIVASTVEDSQGGVLPSTGGMGTTVFTIAGAVLVIGAGALLVTRRRMEK